MRSPTSPRLRATELERLDTAIGLLRRMWDEPNVRRWFVDRLDLGQVDAASYRTLRALRQAGTDGASVNDVAIALRVDASTASRFVNRVVDAGDATRTATAGDRRRSTLHLTASGLGKLRRLQQVRIAFLGRLTEDWPVEDVVELAALLQRLDDAVERLQSR